MWPYMFSQLADEYDRRYGLDTRHLHAIAELNMRNAKANPLAQTRNWAFGPGSFADDDADNPLVEGCLRRTDCSQVTDGTAGLLLVSDRHHIDNKAHRRLGPRHRRAVPAGQVRPQPAPALRVPARQARRRRRVPARAHSRRDKAGRHRDPRLLLDVGVHGRRPLRHHRTGRELEGDRKSVV